MVKNRLKYRDFNMMKIGIKYDSRTFNFFRSIVIDQKLLIDFKGALTINRLKST